MELTTVNSHTPCINVRLIENAMDLPAQPTSVLIAKMDPVSASGIRVVA
jgi:hypothetical protein